MHQIAQMISELSRCRLQYITDSMQPYELKACHAVNLSHICSRPGISQDTLARLRYADKSSIARQVATLEEEGLITRTPCNDDKRVMKLYPTDKAVCQAMLLPVPRTETEEVSFETLCAMPSLRGDGKLGSSLK